MTKQLWSKYKENLDIRFMERLSLDQKNIMYMMKKINIKLEIWLEL